VRCGHRTTMTMPAAPGETHRFDDTYGAPPVMPSIGASALQESRRLMAVARRTVATLLLRG